MDNEFEKRVQKEEKIDTAPMEDNAEITETSGVETVESNNEPAEETAEIRSGDDQAESTEEEKNAVTEETGDETAQEETADEEKVQDVEPESHVSETLLEENGEKKNFFQRWKEKELAKEKAKQERYEKSEENMRRLREQRRAEMYADGKEPNFIQKFLMSEGKYINYENKYGVILGALVILGIVLFILVYRGGYITKEKFGLGKETTRAIVYSKDNELYCYDLKNEPVLISDNLSDGGSVSYSYVGNGTTVAEDGTSVYFIDNAASDGTFSLNYFDAKKKGDPINIADGVADYRISTNGDGAVYIVPEDTYTGTLYGFSKKTKATSVLAEGILLNGSDYEVSADGSKAIFIVEEGSSLSLNICGIDGSNQKTVDTDIAQYLVTSEDKYVYYVKAAGAEDNTSSYSIYKYDMAKDESVLIDGNVIAVTLSRDENAVIYYKYNSSMIKASDVINDDGDTSEATEGLRAAVKEYEFRDITCSVYRYEDGIANLVNDKVFTAIPMDGKGKFIAYTVPQGLDKIKINLSEISSVNEIPALYYMQAMQAECDTYVYKDSGFDDYVPFEDSYLYSFQNSGNDVQFACFSGYDENSKTGKLVLSTYYEEGIRKYSELEDDVESFQFMGDGSRIAYLRGVDADGIGTLVYIESNVADEVSDSAYYYEVTTDLYRRIYYLDNYNSDTYGGTFHYYQQAKDVVIDENVYMFAYRNNNNAFYMKDYNTADGTGDLYYFDGKNSVLVAEDVTSVFDFYNVG